MRLCFGFTLTGLLIVSSAAPSQACCGHRSKCRGHQRVMAAPACQPTVMAAPVAAMPAMSYASPQFAAAPTMAPAPVAPPMAAAPAAAPGVQPSYDYAAGTNGQPAYYYTYDSSGKLIIAQWMDWVFRGGRAAGEPAPPLPIIGALRGR